MQEQSRTQDQQKRMAKLVAKTWADERFKARLIADPAAVLKAEGLDIPDGVTLKVVENTDKVMTLVLPARPTDLSDADLDSLSAGACCGWVCVCCAAV